jgi:cell division protease FtsH
MEQGKGQDKDNPVKPNPMQEGMDKRRLIVWVLVLWLAAAFFFNWYGGTGGTSISYTKFKDQVRQGNVEQILVEGDQISGKLKNPQKLGERENSPEVEHFQTVKPPLEDQNLLNLLHEKGVTINAESQQESWWSSFLVILLPWVLIIGFFIYSSKKMQERLGGMGGGAGKGGGPFGFFKSKAKIYTKSKSDVRYEDVAGLEKSKKELQEVVEYLKDPDRFKTLGGELPKGILLVGPPGTGKTLLARAVAGEADVPFYMISGSEFIEMFVGVGASRVRDMFDQAKRDAPAIIFVDELDSIGRVRGTGLGGGHDEREQTLNQILSEMDGFDPRESVVVLAATNRPDVLDPALVRPGRFDRRITLELPQKEARKKILQVHTREVPLADDLDLDIVAGQTVGFSGAKLKNLVNEAALLAAREAKKQVTQEEFDRAVDKIRMGLEREDYISEDEKKIIAYHEAGHALVAAFLPKADPLRKVTIIPRGRALGATEQLPDEDRHNLSKEYLLARIAIMVAGRAAEKMTFGDLTSGAGDDLNNATQLVRRMVCQWGMSEKIGPVTFNHGKTHPFLGREIAQEKDFSERTAELIDDEVRRIVSEMEDKARGLLEENREKLDRLADALLERETLEEPEIAEILDISPEEKKVAQQGG